MGRPLKEIDADEVFEMAKDGCTQEEVADHFGCARSVISERFRQEFELGKAASKTSLRRMQFDKARSGSDTMLIHLGKVYLGQTDRIDVTSKGEGVASPVVILPVKEMHAADVQAPARPTDSIPG